MDEDMQISRRPSIGTGVPLTGNRDSFAILDAGRYGDSDFLLFLD